MRPGLTEALGWLRSGDRLVVVALDRLGRILFIFYWKNEDFAERYGEEDLAEMEDMLRGVFKSYGDLVLKLKEKSVTDDVSDAEAQIV